MPWPSIKPLVQKVPRITLKRLSTSIIGKIFESLAYRYIDIRRGFTYDFMENGEYALIKKLSTDHRGKSQTFIFFDVGANHGDWTDLVRECFSQQKYIGYLFEISEEMVKTLESRFGQDSKLVLNNVALSDRTARLEFRKYPGFEQLNTLQLESKYWERLESKLVSIDATTGDSYCKRLGIEFIDLLKIDTEGWEWNVIQGFRRMLSESRIGIVQFEYGYTSGDLGFLSKDFFEFFGSMGYRVGPVRKNGVEFRKFEYSDNDFKSGPNYCAAIPSICPIVERQI